MTEEVRSIEGVTYVNCKRDFTGVREIVLMSLDNNNFLDLKTITSHNFITP